MCFRHFLVFQVFFLEFPNFSKSEIIEIVVLSSFVYLTCSCLSWNLLALEIVELIQLVAACHSFINSSYLLEGRMGKKTKVKITLNSVKKTVNFDQARQSRFFTQPGKREFLLNRTQKDKKFDFYQKYRIWISFNIIIA